MFKKDEEMIESILRLDLQNLEAIRKEIAETEKAIADNEALISDLLSEEPMVTTPSKN